MRLTFLSLALVITGLTTTLEARPGDARSHAVRKGETSASIARQHKLSLKQLAALNPGTNLARLSIGQRLTLPGGSAKTVAKSRSLKPEPEPMAFQAQADGSLETKAADSGVPRSAMPTLPDTPVLGPTSLVHLERILPASPKVLNPLSETGVIRPEEGARSASLLASQLQPVLPPVMDLAASPSDSLGFEPVDPSHIDLLWPVETRTVSSAYGPRVRTRLVRAKVSKRQAKKRIRQRYTGSHKGIDLNAPLGTDVYAALGGRVVEVGRGRGFGNLVILDHGNGVTTIYAHNRINHVRVGDVVRRGQKIAEVGRTGNASGCHVHFELRLQGQSTNPMTYLNDLEEIPEDVLASNALVGGRRSLK